MSSVKDKLITLLQNAHAGERAAAYAYRGHANSVTKKDEVIELKKIEMEEWEHRNCLAKMLAEVGSGPRPSREWMMMIVGSTISFLCLCGRYINIWNFGWFMAMYGAGKLERKNIAEYEVAAEYALGCGFEHFVDPLLKMAETEWDHELYFRSKSLESAWSKYLKIWSLPPPRTSIRNAFAKRQKSTKSLG